jgi:hypothetical protein
MTRRRGVVVLMTMTFALLWACAAGAAPQKAAPGKVAIKAYINVSSGCQEDTVKLLQGLAAKNKGVTLQIIDFGQPKGRQAWEKSGLGCMGILLNGHHTVTIGEAGHRRVVAFMKPAGFLWSHADLTEAVQDGLKGTLYFGEEPGAEKGVIQAANAEVTARRVTQGDDNLADVLVNDMPVFRLAAAEGEYNPFRRAELVASRLQEALQRGFSPDALVMAETKGNPCIKVGDRIIVTVYPDDAKSAKSKPDPLAQRWGGNLIDAIIAARKGG